jgi:hypothetical protein
MTSAYWAEAVDPRVREAFFLGHSGGDRYASMIPRLYGVRTSTFANEKILGIGGIPSNGWNFEDSGRLQEAEAVKGYEETFTHHEFGRKISAERKLIDDNRIQEVLDTAGMLGDSAFRVRETAAAKPFVNAFSAATSTSLDDFGTDVVGADDVALCSAAHPVSPMDATHWNNEGTLSLSVTNVGTVRREMGDFVDMNGDILNVMADEILVPPELEDTLITIVKSGLDPITGNNAVNPQAGRFTPIVWHYLTDANAWWMMDSGLRRQHLRWYDRVPLTLGAPVTDSTGTLAVTWPAYMRFSLGWTDARFIYGNNPS